MSLILADDFVDRINWN